MPERCLRPGESGRWRENLRRAGKRIEMDVERQPDPEEAPMDTGMPPGEHPNSDVPDPDVVEEAERENSPNPSEDELNRRYRPGGEPSGPDPVEEPARPDAAKADDES